MMENIYSELDFEECNFDILLSRVFKTGKHSYEETYYEIDISTYNGQKCIQILKVECAAETIKGMEIPATSIQKICFPIIGELNHNDFVGFTKPDEYMKYIEENNEIFGDMIILEEDDYIGTPVDY